VRKQAADDLAFRSAPRRPLLSGHFRS